VAVDAFPTVRLSSESSIRLKIESDLSMAL